MGSCLSFRDVGGPIRFSVLNGEKWGRVRGCLIVRLDVQGCQGSRRQHVHTVHLAHLPVSSTTILPPLPFDPKDSPSLCPPCPPHLPLLKGAVNRLSLTTVLKSPQQPVHSLAAVDFSTPLAWCMLPGCVAAAILHASWVGLPCLSTAASPTSDHEGDLLSLPFPLKTLPHSISRNAYQTSFLSPDLRVEKTARG